RKMMKLPDEVSVAAWLTPKPCVTAAAAYVMTLYEELMPQLKSSCEYLAGQQHPDGYWASYWWTSPIYATAFALLALASFPEYERCRENALQWLVKQQASNGAWYDDYNSTQPSAFFTGLAIKALLIESSQDYSASIERGVNWLVSNQVDDGSWLTTRILCIPATDVANPKDIKSWRLSSFGVNILVDDHNRIFTTSTVLNALNSHLSSFDEHRWLINTATGHNLLVNKATAKLFILLQNTSLLEQAYAQFNIDFKSNISAHAFSELVNNRFGGYGILADDQSDDKSVAGASYIKLQFEILSAKVVAKCAAPL
nr:hypothetical protein [Tanacetum cinerariifolium]